MSVPDEIGGGMVRDQIDGLQANPFVRLVCIYCDYQMLVPEEEAEEIEWCPKGCEHEDDEEESGADDD